MTDARSVRPAARPRPSATAQEPCGSARYVVGMALAPTSRRRLPRKLREQQLIAVAEAVFADVGVQAASMDEIAERAGISKPVVYDHFGSKDGLLAAVVEEVGRRLQVVAGEAVAGATSPTDALVAGIRAYFVFSEANAGKWTTMMQETTPSSAASAALERLRLEQAGAIAELIEGLLDPAVRPRALAYAQVLVGACERLATWRALQPSDSTPSIDECTSAVCDLVLPGLASLGRVDRPSR